jgi:hypothetical protein
MKHIVPFTVPTGTEAAEVVITRFNGELVSCLRLVTKGAETVSVDVDNLPQGTYSCALVVNDNEVYKRELVVEV